LARARKKRLEEPENHERWLVSYADFITLLFAFFVVMYSISSVNEGKYRVLSDTMVEAFVAPVDEQPGMTVPLLVNENNGTPFVEHNIGGETTISENEGELPPDELKNPAEIEDIDDRLWVVASNLDSSLQGFIDQKQIKVNLQGDKIEIQLSSKLLFGSGSTRLSTEARKVFRDISTIIKPLKNTIYVEGHTDNVPIKTQAFSSNWELSAGRAASVVEYIEKQGVDPKRLAAIGFGEFRPISDNDSVEGRSKNRRVTLILRSSEGSNPYGELISNPDEGDMPWAESPGGL